MDIERQAHIDRGGGKDGYVEREREREGEGWGMGEIDTAHCMPSDKRFYEL